jgi:hypothetical protein
VELANTEGTCSASKVTVPPLIAPCMANSGSGPVPGWLRAVCRLFTMRLRYDEGAALWERLV